MSDTTAVRGTRRGGSALRRLVSPPLVGGLLLLTACSAHDRFDDRAASRGPGDEGLCLLLAGTPSSPTTTVQVAVAGDVDPRHAPAPTTDAERFVFRHLYETLIDLDCVGRALPALAASWEPIGDGTVWRVRLRPGARFWDGSPLDAYAVRLAWLGRPSSAGRFAGIEVEDGATLVLTPARAEADARFLSDLALAVVRRKAEAPWPLGSGTYRPAGRTVSAHAGGRAWVLVPAHASTLAPTLEVRRQDGEDWRDLLDAGGDLLLTRDPALLEYAATLPDVLIRPLPWDRTFALLLRHPVGGEGMPPHLLLDLARDALPMEARPAEGVLKQLDGCSANGVRSSPRLETMPPNERLILHYAEEDADARALAGRIVALARDPRSASPLPDLEAAVGLPRRQLASTLERGEAAAWVRSLPYPLSSPCDTAAQLLRSAPWLAAESLPASLLPLVQTRRRAIARSGLSRLWVDGYGVARLDPPPTRGRRRAR